MSDAALPSATDQEHRQRILDERTRALAGRELAQSAGAAAESQRVLVCAVGAEVFAIPLAGVASVLPAGSYTRLPGAPEGVLGLFGRAGRSFSVLDLAAILRLGQGDPTGGHLLLLRTAPRRVALRVDRVLGVAALAVQPEQILPNSGAVRGQAVLAAGTVDAPQTVVSLLDIDRLLQSLRSPSGNGT